MRKVLVTAVAAAASLITFASAQPAEAKDGAPVSGGYDALYRWCYQTVIRQHG
jgi:hypothetical protein